MKELGIRVPTGVDIAACGYVKQVFILTTKAVFNLMAGSEAFLIYG